MRANEYIHTTPHQRFAMLRALGDLALASEPLRDHITARLEALVAHRPKAEPLPWQQQQQQGLYMQRGQQDEEGSVAEGSPLLPENWVQWIEHHRCVTFTDTAACYLSFLRSSHGACHGACHVRHILTHVGMSTLLRLRYMSPSLSHNPGH